MRFRHPFFPLLPLTVIALLAAIIIPACTRRAEPTAPAPSLPPTATDDSRPN